MANNKKSDQNVDHNSEEFKALTQKQAEAVTNPTEEQEGKSAEERVEQVTQEEVGQDGPVENEGHITPDRLTFNQSDNTAEQFDKAQGTPSEPELKDKPEGPIADRKGTVVDAGYSTEGEQAPVGNTDSEENNYETGKPEEDSESDNSDS